MTRINARDRPRVLFVDDEEMVVSAVRVFLELSGFQVATARNGIEALTRISQMGPETTPNLIILDTIMPQLSGWETLRQLRQQGDTTPVILLLSSSSAADGALALSAGADDFLAKPYDAADLALRIQAVLQRTNRAL
jgi:DNA-binding response OmpR family regulator